MMEQDVIQSFTGCSLDQNAWCGSSIDVRKGLYMEC